MIIVWDLCRFIGHESVEHITSPRSIMYEENSVECRVPVYCYETPPQEPRYIVDSDKCQQNVMDIQKNYWEPQTSTQVNEKKKIYLLMKTKVVDINI